MINWNANSTPRTWTDRTVSSPNAYTYTMLAVDSAGNSSPRSVPLEVRLSARTEHTAVTQVVATAMDEVVQVGWAAPSGKVKHCVIYRSRDGATATTIGSAPAGTNTFVDIRLPGKGSYTYAVKVVYSDGGSSRISEAVAPVVVN